MSVNVARIAGLERKVEQVLATVRQVLQPTVPPYLADRLDRVCPRWIDNGGDIDALRSDPSFLAWRARRWL